MNKKSDKKHKHKRKQAKNKIKGGGLSFFSTNKNKEEEEQKHLLPINRLPHQDPNVEPSGINSIKSVSRCSIL
jgi:hypothetical protein